MDRHKALQMGEVNPDFVFLGKLGKDIKPDPHPKNLQLAKWWAEFVEVPGIAAAGNAIESVAEVAESGIDFVLMQSAVFGDDVNSQEAVARANALLDKHAPELTGDD